MLPLKGSEKQIQWATTIRQKKLKEWELESGSNPSLMEAVTTASHQTDSGWWISYRESKLRDVEKHLRTGYSKVQADKAKYQKEQVRKDAPEPKNSSPAGIGGQLKSVDAMMFAGPLRDVVTGKVVNDPDPDIPF